MFFVPQLIAAISIAVIPLLVTTETIAETNILLSIKKAFIEKTKIRQLN